MLIDDHLAMRNEIAAIIENETRFEVVGTASNGIEGVEQAKKLRPDVIVMDVVMPHMNGIEAAQMIHQTLPETRILVLSNYTGTQLIQASMDAGAIGYLRKNLAIDELIRALHTVADGKVYIDQTSEQMIAPPPIRPRDMEMPY